jgi:HSP20 family protein
LDAGFLPAIDVIEEKDKLVVRCDLPGFNKDDVTVTLEDNCLSIKGERKAEAVSKEANYYRQERMYGSFHRVFELPTSVDAKSIEAHFRDGVLQVALPKAEEVKPKQIPVKVN